MKMGYRFEMLSQDVHELANDITTQQVPAIKSESIAPIAVDKPVQNRSYFRFPLPPLSSNPRSHGGTPAHALASKSINARNFAFGAAPGA